MWAINSLPMRLNHVENVEIMFDSRMHMDQFSAYIPDAGGVRTSTELCHSMNKRDGNAEAGPVKKVKS